MGSGSLADWLAERLQAQGASPARDLSSDWTGLQIDSAQLRLSDGRTASTLGREVAVFDRPMNLKDGVNLAWAPSCGASDDWVTNASQWLMALGLTPVRVADAPGLVVARTLAMLINEAADAVQQGVCSQEGADAAMKLGVNYPAGPFEWLAGWSVPGVVAVLEALDTHYRGERYRVSPWLRQRQVF